MMFATSTVIFTVLIYMVLLFTLAQWAEHRAVTTGRANHPLIYALSFNVYSTSWAFSVPSVLPSAPAECLPLLIVAL